VSKKFYRIYYKANRRNFGDVEIKEFVTIAVCDDKYYRWVQIYWNHISKTQESSSWERYKYGNISVENRRYKA